MNEIQAIADHEGLLQCRELLGITDPSDNVYDGIKRLQAKLSDLKTILSRIQWEGCLCSFSEEMGCPECTGHRDEGHMTDCKLGQALK